MRKHNLLAWILVMLCVLLSVAACGGQTSSNSHDHEFSNVWSNDEHTHWYGCTVSGCAEKETGSEANHTFDEGVITTEPTEGNNGIKTFTCTVCGFKKNEPTSESTHKHTWESAWSSDDNYHWYESTCGHMAKDKGVHIYDNGYIAKESTDTEEGLIVYTCIYCGYDYEEVLDKEAHKHTFSDTLSYDENNHWYATLCGHSNVRGFEGHDFSDGVVTVEPTEDETGVRSYYCSGCEYVKEEVLDILPHVHAFDEETLACRCGLVHTTCEICELCSTVGCPNHRSICAFEGNEDRVISFAPSITLSPPEGPDGKEPGKEGAYIYDTSITASYTVLDNGAHATLVTLPNGTAANSGISFANNRDCTAHGKAGFSCGVPLIGGYTKYIRVHFTNHGDSDLTFKYSAINYYIDYGAAELTLKAGESTTVVIKTLLSGDSSGLNHQIVFLEAAEEGASISIWGEFVADERLSGISVSAPATKTAFAIGETFSADGLILKANGSRFDYVYIVNNYTTDLDGYVFTAEDAAAGKKTVTVNFAGFTTTYELTVSEHIHNLEYVEKVAPVACTTDGTEAYYVCTVADCGKYFADSLAINEIAAPAVISCHTEPAGAILPGSELLCSNCDYSYGVSSMENWMLFTPPAKIHSTMGDTIGSVKLEYGEVNGAAGTLVTFSKDAVGSASNSSGFKFACENNLEEDGGVPYQHKIPNVGTNMADGSTRELVMYFRNYGTEDVTLTFVNDGNRSISITVTVPAGGYAIGETTMVKAAGYNYFELYLNNTEALESDVQIGMYGYVRILDGETNNPTIKQAASINSFKVGETFSAEGLVLNAFLPNTYGRDLFVWTGYTTNLDGYTFTESDVGTKTVTVTFAGKTCTYKITVTAE